MKITRLKITNYKNLNAELIHDSDIIALIGNNGSGKSNLLEAISLIFRSLYAAKTKLDFDYEIEYINSLKQHIKIEKRRGHIEYYVNQELQLDISDYLPKKLIAIYSGEEGRLFEDCFAPFYLEFVRGINRANSQGTEYSDLPKMLYLNKFYWHISLLSLLVSDSEDNKDFIKNVLKIEQVDKIKIDFNNRNYEEYKDNLALGFVKDIDSKTEYRLEDFKKTIADKGYIPDDVYKYLYLAYTPRSAKIIEDITIRFNKNLTITDLSEGEKKLLLIKAALEFAGHEDSLFILDEPDAHIHINNKEQIINCFQPYKGNRQIILTTHSPTLTQSIEDTNLYMVNSGKIIERKKQEIIGDLTDEFWNKHQQSSFLSSKKKMILLVEGKHDKTHICNAFDKLKEDSSSLDFDIYSLGGESKIHPFMNGLYETNIQNDVIYIGIYDNDRAGIDTLNKAGFMPEENLNGYRKLKGDKFEHNHFFAFALPKPDSYTSHCTIENMYAPTKYEDALKEAFAKNFGKHINKSIDAINDDIKNDSKNILADNSSTFDKVDFINFKKLFDLICKIQADCKRVVKKVTTARDGTSDPGDDSDKALPKDENRLQSTDETKKPKLIIIPLNPRPNVKEWHLEYWTAFKEFVATQKVHFKVTKPMAQHWLNISVGRTNFKIAVISNTQKKFIAIQLVCSGDKALEHFKALRNEYEADSKIELSTSVEWIQKMKVGVKEHHVNLVIPNKNPLDKRDWGNQHLQLSDWTERFYLYFKDKIQAL